MWDGVIVLEVREWPELDVLLLEIWDGVLLLEVWNRVLLLKVWYGVLLLEVWDGVLLLEVWDRVLLLEVWDGVFVLKVREWPELDVLFLEGDNTTDSSFGGVNSNLCISMSSISN